MKSEIGHVVYENFLLTTSYEISNINKNDRDVEAY